VSRTSRLHCSRVACRQRQRQAVRAALLADEFVTQLLRQGDAKVFKKYSQIKLQMKREALAN
jgi:hypothetical protein